MTTIEKIARELEPQAWAALGIGDTLAYKNRRKSSLRKAERVVRAIRTPNTIARFMPPLSTCRAAGD